MGGLYHAAALCWVYPRSLDPLALSEVLEHEPVDVRVAERTGRRHSCDTGASNPNYAPSNATITIPCCKGKQQSKEPSIDKSFERVGPAASGLK
jgi:hypothetical protein